MRSLMRSAWKGARLSFVLSLLVIPGAVAQEGESVATRLRYETVDGDRVPVEGGRVTVATLDGEVVAEGFSDAEGNIEIPVPGPGDYVLTLDPETLPEGVALRDPERLSTETQVLEGQTGRVIFALISGDVTIDTDAGADRAITQFFYDTDAFLRFLDRCRSAEEAGVGFTLHSDFMVTDPDPLHMIEMAVTRKTWKEPDYVLAPEERISVETAIRALTWEAAWQLGSEHEIGSLEPGKLADLVILDRDPREVDPDRIKDIQVLETWMDGRRVFVA